MRRSVSKDNIITNSKRNSQAKDNNDKESHYSNDEFESSVLEPIDSEQQDTNRSSNPINSLRDIDVCNNGLVNNNTALNKRSKQMRDALLTETNSLRKLNRKTTMETKSILQTPTKSRQQSLL